MMRFAICGWSGAAGVGRVRTFFRIFLPRIAGHRAEMNRVIQRGKFYTNGIRNQLRERREDGSRGGDGWGGGGHTALGVRKPPVFPMVTACVAG